MQKDVRSVATCDTQGKQTEEQFFKNYKKSFFTAVKWNTFESLGYQIVFVIHQVGLFLYCDRALYGKVGALISASYLAVTLLVAGFDGGLLPFFKKFISNKKIFKTFLVEYVAQQVLIMALVAYAAFFLVAHTYPLFSLAPATLFLLTTFIVVEGVKKILKQLLYLGFHNQQAALLEVIQIVFYVLTVWGWHWYGLPFSLELFLLPFIGYSFVFCIFCVVKLLNYYRTLVCENSSFELPSFQNFFSIRCAVLINQMSRSFFSSNFLVPLFALHGGFKEAGVLTFANYLTHACTFFIQKITLPPAEALFSRMKQLPIVLHFRAFSLVLSLFATLTTLVGFLFFFKGRACAESFGCGTLDHLTWAVLIFFFFIHLLESMFMLYEKFFLLQERVFLLALGNVISCLFCYLLFMTHLSFFTLVFSCIFVRFSFFVLLSFFIYRLKQAPRGPIESQK